MITHVRHQSAVRWARLAPINRAATITPRVVAAALVAGLGVLALVGSALVAGLRPEEIAPPTLAVLLAIAVALIIKRVVPALTTPVLIAAGSVSQALVFFLIVALGYQTDATGNPSMPPLISAPWTASMSMLCVPIGALIGALLLRMVHRPLRSGVSTLQLMAANTNKLRVCYIAVSALMLLSWGATSPGLDAINYVVRVLSNLVSPFAFLAGMVAWSNRAIRRVWIAALAASCVLAVLTGSRSPAFIPAALFVLGYFVTVFPLQPVRAATLAIGTGFVLATLSGAVAIARDDIGRGTAETINVDRVRLMIPIFSTAVASTSVLRTDGSRSGVLQGALDRMFVWPNAAAAVMSPELKPYRQFDGFQDEIRAYSTVAYLAGLTPDDFFDANLGATPANDYGFSSNVQNGIEWGVLADGWSRAGPIGAVLFGVVLTIFLASAELLSRWCLAWAGPLSLLVFAVSLEGAIGAQTYSMLAIIRAMLLQGALLFAIVVLTGVPRLAAYLRQGRSL